MKRLLFILAFTFFVQQAFSQIFLVTLTDASINHTSGCSSSLVNELVLTKTEPNGNQTYTCIPRDIEGDTSPLSILNQELNSVVSQGYKLIETNNGSHSRNGLLEGGSFISGSAWYFAIPWTASSLEEVFVNTNSLKISPNPANTFVDISLDYNLKGESEVVFISEAGYISHKQSIGNISENEKYNIDISKIPSGKYLVTIVNGKTYTTPQKLIVI